MTSAPSFRLLPVEATEAMLDTAATEDWADWDQQMPADHYAALYRVMVSAAPVMAEATDEMVDRAMPFFKGYPLTRDYIKAALNAALAIAAGQLGEKESGDG